MRIGKIVVTIACSLLMAGVALAEIAPTPADNSALELSVVSKKISAADDDYGKISSILRSFYDRSIGQADIEGQTPVYAGGDYTNAQVPPGIPCVPYMNKNKSSTKNLFEESIQGSANDKGIQYDFSHLSKVGGCLSKCVASHTEKQCGNRKRCRKTCVVGAVVCYIVGGNSVCAPGAAVCSLVCEYIPECRTITVCDKWERACW